MQLINYFFEKHIEKCKKELENFENNKFKEVREDLRVETRKYLEEINNFLSGINAESYTDFQGFNNKIKIFNDELNRIMKASANISTLVYVIQNVSEDDFYTYTDFINSFFYDENKFNNASERDIKQLKRFDKLIEKTDDDFELYKERGDLRAELGFYNESIDDYKKALELNTDYKEAKNALEEINKKLINAKTINKKIKTNNNDVKNNNTQNKKIEKYYEEGVNYHKERKYKEAVQAFDKVIELNPNYSIAYNGRGNARKNLGEYQEAIQDFNKAIELNPNYSMAYYNRGIAKYYLGKNLRDIKELLEDFKKALELDPNNKYAKDGMRSIKKQYDLR